MIRLRLLWRKSLNAVMLSLTGVAAFAVVSVLFLILGYLLMHGGTSLSWDFFTKLPKPVGESGGGMANAIVGSLKLLLLAAVMGLPVGLLAGVYLAEFGGKTFSFVIRYTTDLLNGVPSIVIGIFAYSLVVLPVKHFSTLAGGVALAMMVIPITVRSTEEFLRAVPGSLREGAMALGAAGAGPCRGRNRPAVVHRIQQPILEPRLGAALCLAPGYDLYLRHRALRRLAPASLGRGTGAADACPARKLGLPAGIESPRFGSERLIWPLPLMGRT